jgi:uncharacterized SAM-binding protein YcdF (DUF218 family)
MATVVPRLDRESPVDAVVVLSSGVLKNGSLDTPGRRRLLTGEAYAKRYGAPALITTHVRRRKPPYLTSDLPQHLLIDSAGLSAIWRHSSQPVRSTHDEAETVAQLEPGKHIAVVTSRFHTRRACATFEKVGFEVTCVSSGWNPWWEIPYLALYEGAALIKYRLKGWI